MTTLTQTLNAETSPKRSLQIPKEVAVASAPETERESHSRGEFKSLLIAELHDAVFKSVSLLKKIYPAPSDEECTKAISAIMDSYFPANPKSESLPSDGFPYEYLPLERDNYEPLCALLDEIVNAIPAKSRARYYRDLCFRVYEQNTSDKEIKPNLVGVLGKQTGQISWRMIGVAVEVQDNWSEAFMHAAAHGRSMLELSGVWYAPVFVYNHSERRLCFTWTTHLGFFLSPSFDLTVKSSFKSFVEGIAGLVALDGERAGVDTFQRAHAESLHFNLPISNWQGTWWTSNRTIMRGACIRGRATHVYALEASLNLGPGSRFDSTSGCITSSELNTFIVDAPNPCWQDIPLWEIPPGTTGVLKSSWPLTSRAYVEANMLMDVQGNHGIPHVIGTAVVPHPLQVFTTLDDIKKSGIFSKRVYSIDTKDRPLRLEPRSHQLIFYSQEGKSLYGANTNCLVYALVDGMIAHLNIFLQGILQRDVSIGNILRYQEPLTSTPECININNCFTRIGNCSDFAFLRTHMKKAVGFIIDGDHAVYWKKDGHQGQHRAGTRQFVSRRLEDSYIAREPKLHSAIDDLESFIWLAIWVALFSTHPESHLEQEIMHAWSADDLSQVSFAKNALEIHINWRDTCFSQPLQELLPLLKEWFRIADAAWTALELLIKDHVEKSEQPDQGWEGLVVGVVRANGAGGFFEELEGLCLVYYKQYLGAAIEFLQERGAYGTKLEGKNSQPTSVGHGDT